MKYLNHEATAKPRVTGSGAASTWKKALGALSGPALRLHHYREVRAKVLHDAMFLSERQRCASDPRNCDSAGC